MPPERTITRIPKTPFETLKTGKNHLFAIGINTYSDFNPLSNARKDIEDLAAILSEHYYFEPSNMQLICDEDATRGNIIDELNGLRAKIKDNDRLLIYYSGHGFSDDERGYWIPVDAKKNRVSSFISNAEVRDIIKAIKARHILLISDSCFSSSLLTRDASRDIGKSFLNWDKDPSRYVFISGKGVVSDGEKGKNSPFAASILKHLNRNEAEALNIVQLADIVTKEIQFNYEQQAEISPLNQAGHSGGQFIFFKKQTERDDWQAALAKNTEGGYLAYLDKYENGQFEKDAEAKLLDIADEKEWNLTISHDAAYYYRQYLRKFKNGKYAVIAQTKLDAIAELEREQEQAKRKEQEAKREEQERLAKIEADKKEREQLAKIEADKKEREQLAKIEADKKEREQLAKIEVDRKEREQLAKIEADRKEREQLAKIEADKKEPEQFAKIEADRKERERLAKIEADKKERARRIREEADIVQPQLIDNQQDEPSFIYKNRFALSGGGIVAAGLLIWQMTGTPTDTPSVKPTNPTTEQTQNNNTQPQSNNPTTNPNTTLTEQKGATTVSPKQLKDQSISVGKPVDAPKPQPQKTTVDPSIEANRIAKQKQDAADEAEKKRKDEEERQRQLALQTRIKQLETVKGYLNIAKAKADAQDKGKTFDYIQKATDVTNLPKTVTDALSLARAKTDSGDFAKAVDWIQKAIDGLK